MINILVHNFSPPNFDFPVLDGDVTKDLKEKLESTYSFMLKYSKITM